MDTLTFPGQARQPAVTFAQAIARLRELKDTALLATIGGLILAMTVLNCGA